MTENPGAEGPSHPLAPFVRTMSAVVVDALSTAAGTTRPPRTVAELDQLLKAADDVEAVLCELIDAEREEALLSVQEEMRW